MELEEFPPVKGISEILFNVLFFSSLFTVLLMCLYDDIIFYVNVRNKRRTEQD